MDPDSVAFWGVTVKPGEPLKLELKEAESLNVTMASLGPKLDDPKGRSVVMMEVGAESQKYACCVLRANSTECTTLDLRFDGEDSLTFTLVGKNEVHLTGNFCFDDDDDEDDDDGEDLMATLNGDMAELDEEDDDEENEGDTILNEPPLIKELDDEDDEEDDEEDADEDNDVRMTAVKKEVDVKEEEEEDDEEEEEDDDDDEEDDEEDEKEEEKPAPKKQVANGAKKGGKGNKVFEKKKSAVKVEKTPVKPKAEVKTEKTPVKPKSEVKTEKTPVKPKAEVKTEKKTVTIDVKEEPKTGKKGGNNKRKSMDAKAASTPAKKVKSEANGDAEVQTPETKMADGEDLSHMTKSQRKRYRKRKSKAGNTPAATK